MLAKKVSAEHRRVHKVALERIRQRVVVHRQIVCVGVEGKVLGQFGVDKERQGSGKQSCQPHATCAEV